jgi:tRNA A-37 threonylcarbamoyl transferase component Bud32
MGEVFEGVHDAIERHVAIKVLHPEYAQRPEFISRFFNEARAVNRIDHPGLVQVSDFGQLADKTAYIVMEYLKGESLGERLKGRGGPLELPQVLNLGCQLADSLAAAHEKGIIHRDLKPDNVMVVADLQMPGGERTKLLDFGIAKLTEDGPVEVKTRTNSMMGTVYYMSPEQCKGAAKVDDRADVYSFGVMMYEMLSGERPFTGEGHGEIVVKQIMVEPEPLTSKAPSVPPEVADLVHRTLIKDKSKRPSMAEVAAELDELRALAPSPSPRRNTGSVPVATGSRASGMLRPVGTATAAGQSAAVRRGPQSLVMIGAGVVLLGAVGLGASQLLRKPQPVVAQPQPVAAPLEKAPQPQPVAPGNDVAPPVVAKDPPPAAPVSHGPVKKGKGGKRGNATAAPAKPAGKPAAPIKKAPGTTRREIEE